MADEEKNEQVEETPEEASAEETPAEEAPAEEPATEDAGADDAEQGGSDPAAGSEAEEAAGGDDEPLSPKQARKLERSRAEGPAKPQRSVDERVSERVEARRRAASARSRYRKRQAGRRGERGGGTPPADRPPGPKKMRVGKVVSTKADKTITVRIEVARRHPEYEKVVRRSATVHAHDAANQAQEGDLVRVVETRPLSRTKRWRLTEILERAR